NWCL
ncbi:unnamed protein product, partial [Allacma fusca]